MPLREAEYKELCAVCRARTDQGCRRCSLPLCSEHLPDPDASRCPDCEDKFEQRVAHERMVLHQAQMRRPLRTSGLIGGALLSLAVIAGLAAAASASAAAVVGVGLLIAALVYGAESSGVSPGRARRAIAEHRAHFLEERVGKQLTD